MNRKLHNSMLGLGATGLMLVFALMAASPVSPGQDASAPLGFAASASAAVPTAVAMQADADAIEASARDIEARARRFESELEGSDSLGDTIASAMSFAAAVSTEAALSAAFEATADEAEHKRAAAKEKRRHARQVRGALAVPYFSFAQGLRRGSRS